jgi:hypothetical protein
MLLAINENRPKNKLLSLSRNDGSSPCSQQTAIGLELISQTHMLPPNVFGLMLALTIGLPNIWTSEALPLPFVSISHIVQLASCFLNGEV